MKILYISHQKEESGYGRYCRDFLESLKYTGHKIVSYPLILGKPGNYKDETESEPITNCQLTIQNILPHFVERGNFDKNIAICITESDLNKKWENRLSFVDEVWYPHIKLELFENERSIPVSIDTSKYSKEYPKMNISELDGTYKFYWIGELSKRKNLSALLLSYFQNFTHSDPVSLLIKVHNNNFDSNSCRQEVENLIQKTAYGCKIYKNIEDYPRVLCIPDYWKNDQISALHKYCDCFVSTSFGESICYPMIDAAGFNKEIISSSNQASLFYSSFMNINVVKTRKERCYGEVENFDFLNTSNDYWNTVNTDDFGKMMRKVYENRIVINNDLSILSYQKIGEFIKKCL